MSLYSTSASTSVYLENTFIRGGVVHVLVLYISLSSSYAQNDFMTSCSLVL